MASQQQASSSDAGRAYFAQQRGILIGEIATSFEHVLTNINKLNRSLEAIITVGNEFSSVEALWSQFEGVMGKEEQQVEAQEDDNGDGDGDGEESRDESHAESTEVGGEDEDEDEDETVVEARGRR
ncbi:uncharacterized protein DNG_06541 [Cephalotrichum gorgonifer]|uniref:DASH complex subunit DAD1 n=1 Tax=Cephalotrichum gorgonifer TaxID=2041049 RepID=A0AAE8N1S5_9PEZI|nr:uncharacterized protein DNG_06541 [Cephalotrichum gorgonifer]